MAEGFPFFDRNPGPPTGQQDALVATNASDERWFAGHKKIEIVTGAFRIDLLGFR
jgi:hypothetical protein